MKLPEVTTENFNEYIEFLRSHPILREEDQEAKLLAAGVLKDERMIKEMFNCNARFVASIAKKYSVQVFTEGSELQLKLWAELINPGNKGLLRAVKTYYDQNVTFFNRSFKNVMTASIMASIEEYFKNRSL